MLSFNTKEQYKQHQQTIEQLSNLRFYIYEQNRKIKNLKYLHIKETNEIIEVNPGLIKKYDITNKSNELINSFADTSLKYTKFEKLKFIIKTKDKNDTHSIKNLLKTHSVQNNIIVSHNLNLHEVFQNSLIVFGYNSLAFAEALL